MRANTTTEYVCVHNFITNVHRYNYSIRDCHCDCRNKIYNGEDLPVNIFKIFMYFAFFLKHTYWQQIQQH